MLVQQKNKYERNPNRVNVACTALGKIEHFRTMQNSKMQFDINICDTHVPHWRKQCESEKRKHHFVFWHFFARIFFFSGINCFQVVLLLYRLLARFFFHSLLCWYTRKHFQFCYWFPTFSGRKIVGRNVFTALKLTEKSIMIFRECSEQKAMEQLPRKNDVFCINNLLQSHSPNAPSCSRCLSYSSAVRQCGRHFQLRNYYTDFLKCSDCFAFECCSKIHSIQWTRPNCAVFFCCFGYARNALCAEPINDKRLRVQSECECEWTGNTLRYYL